MAAKDKFHNAVKQGLEKDQWVITHDPLRLEYAQEERVEIDLGAEKILGAEKEGQKIAVEVKSFLNDSALADFHTALGQFLNYRLVLEKIEPERVLYLAVPSYAYQSFFQKELPSASVKYYNIKVIVYDPVKEEIVRWVS
ncbi:MAG: XisH family protein [Spirulinaceae cyanobacterium]